MKVKEIMSAKLKKIEPDETIRFAAQIMNKYGIGSLIVVDSFELSGIITERDILKAFAEGKSPDTPVKSIMTRKVVMITPDTTLEQAAKLMTKHKIKRLPVCKENVCVGIVTATDLMKYEDTLVGNLASLYMLPRKKIGAG
ncbi:MAG: CBS domain-containing protein [Candidatus Aenigmarchaeota archaeon]|nr:CBS domain-containing protein [Candidatus Aenigmarchaeota archaeon]